MASVDFPNEFYIGRKVNPEDGEATKDAQTYDPDDLTTHAVVVGMTGSGKTGLCLDLMEEAALNNLPAILIDPKGDITNLLLHFPELLPTELLRSSLGLKLQTVHALSLQYFDLW